MKAGTLTAGRVEIFEPDAQSRHFRETLRANRLVELAAVHLMRQALYNPNAAPDYDAAYAYAETELAKRSKPQ
jgi:hypothetical protein